MLQYICEELKQIYEDIPLSEFTPCAYKLWEILPICKYEPPLLDLCYFSKSPTKKNMVQADTTYREMFKYYLEGFDTEADNMEVIKLQDYLTISAGTVEPDFERAEMLLGFHLNQGVRNFYSRAYAKKVSGNITIPEKGFILPRGNKRFDSWFDFNEIKGNTEIHLYPCISLKSSPRFIRDHFYTWTGGRILVSVY